MALVRWFQTFFRLDVLGGVTVARARHPPGDLMGIGGQERVRAEPIDPTGAETVEKHTSALVGTVLASILWVLNFGDGRSAEETTKEEEEAAA